MRGIGDLRRRGRAFERLSETVVVLGIPQAPGQPRIEVRDASALRERRPDRRWRPGRAVQFECRDIAGAAGAVVGLQTAQQPSAVVGGLANGGTFECVAYAENSIGRSPASVASARFSPCGGFFDCNPWAKWSGAVFVLVATLAALWFVARRYAPEPRLDHRAGRRRREPPARLGPGDRHPARAG